MNKSGSRWLDPRTLLAIGAAALVQLAPLQLWAANVTVETHLIGGEAPSAGGTGFFDIDAKGRVVGTSFSTGDYHGFLREADGSLQSIEVPDDMGSSTFAFGINDAGEIVGSYIRDAVGGFVRRADGTFTAITIDGAVTTTASGINNLGSIVGSFQTRTISPFESDGTQGYVRHPDGTVSTLTVPNARYTIATGINDHGQVVGHYRSSTGASGGFVTDGAGGFTLFDFGELAGPSLYVSGIDNDGRVVGVVANPVLDDGSLLDGNGVFIREPDGTIHYLDLPDTVASDSPHIGIASTGVMVGTLRSRFAPTGTAEDVYGFIATPVQAVPIPPAVGLFTLALAGLGLSLRRQAARL